MFVVNAHVENDGDFRFIDSEFHEKDNGACTYYFESRQDAVNAIIKSFHNVCNTLDSKCPHYVKSYVEFIDDKIELIAAKAPTFSIQKALGNYAVVYELLEADKIYNANGSYYYEACTPSIYIGELYNKIDWDKLSEFPDVTEEPDVEER